MYELYEFLCENSTVDGEQQEETEAWGGEQVVGSFRTRKNKQEKSKERKGMREQGRGGRWAGACGFL